MILLVCALACEAKSLIQHFRLKQATRSSSFPVYENDSIYLIVSGIGKLNAAAATSYLYGFAGMPHEAIWLNVGIAGHWQLPLGTGVLAHQIRDAGSQKSYYPCFACEKPVSTAPLLTVDRPHFGYEEEVLYDMEASGFYAAASRFSIVEWIHCYKIISDNASSDRSSIQPNFVHELCLSHLTSIESFLSSLKHLKEKLDQEIVPQKDFHLFLERWHFTQTQQHRLKNLLQRYQACSLQPLAFSSFFSLSSAKEVLNFLEEAIQALPLTYLSG